MPTVRSSITRAGASRRPFATGIGSDTTFSLEYLHQQEDNLPDFGIPFVFDKPAPVSLKNFYGLPDDDRQKTDVEVVTGRVEHKFNDIFSISDTARFGSYWFDTRQTGATYGDANCFDTPTPPYPGAPAVFTDGRPKSGDGARSALSRAGNAAQSGLRLARPPPASAGTITTLMNEFDLNGRFATGSLQHTLVTGLEVDREVGDLDRLGKPGRHHPADAGCSIPIRSRTFQAIRPVRRDGLSPRRQPSASSPPTMFRSTRHWSVIGALRFDHFGAEFHDTVNDARYSHDDNIVSPRAAVVYKPGENSSVYFSYGTSFNPPAANLSLASSNNDLAPGTRPQPSKLGGKVVALDGLLGLTAAVFNTRMTNARTADPEDPGEQTFSGTQRVNGFEFTANGRITPQWEIIGGYIYLDTRDLQSQGPGLIGPISQHGAQSGEYLVGVRLRQWNQRGLWARTTPARARRVSIPKPFRAR
ncbi:MAG: TonB-dependent receptor [Rhizomicrobium sp.]